MHVRRRQHLPLFCHRLRSMYIVDVSGLIIDYISINLFFELGSELKEMINEGTEEQPSSKGVP